MTDLIQRLRERAESYRSSGPSSEHTASLLDEAANEIDVLRWLASASLRSHGGSQHDQRQKPSSAPRGEGQ